MRRWFTTALSASCADRTASSSRVIERHDELLLLSKQEHGGTLRQGHGSTIGRQNRSDEV
jgi:hypothetical protein